MLLFTRWVHVPLALVFLLPAGLMLAQGNYEVQVYGADLVAARPHHGGTALELHL